MLREHWKLCRYIALSAQARATANQTHTMAAVEGAFATTDKPGVKTLAPVSASLFQATATQVSRRFGMNSDLREIIHLVWR